MSAPASAKAIAMERPIPLVLPVTKAVLPVKLNNLLILISRST